MIIINNLYKNFSKNPVLKNINLNIESSKITAIAGPNGSGKTTLIKSILGLVKTDKGKILINGTDISKNDDYRKLIGYMPQIGRYPENQTIRGVFSMIKDLRGIKHLPRLDELINFFGLEEHLLKKMSTLSGGTRQKVSAVIALMFDSDILILDEPTSGLDPVSASKLKDTLLSEKNEGRTIILISHIMSEVEELADNLVYLLDGEIILEENINHLINYFGKLNLEKTISSILQGKVA